MKADRIATVLHVDGRHPPDTKRLVVPADGRGFTNEDPIIELVVPAR